MKRYIITGAPGTGKTTLINALRKKGFTCFEEVSRRIIKQQQAINGTKTPWQDVNGFTQLVYNTTTKELNTSTNTITFVDRSLADNIAYLQLKNCAINEELATFNYHKHYHNIVFFLPIWKAIYVQDNQRIQSFEDAKKLDLLLYKTYQELGFKIIVLDKDTVSNRELQITNLVK
ncbi:hypothetical protein A8C32_08145 [Flavivirga aquatica]|uniref:NadR/Ttd14 AAA domain-containing protein n=1 Tax=Flavivirga aquatica TaxID=1849968 RepID=A0A1E5SJA0_9FLAO|nr:AAA family ATPase [Flavivirga aquatica]OEJ99136.1 hypothetical protein A8C32_08145 [Flavivirga aquatica]